MSVWLLQPFSPADAKRGMSFRVVQICFSSSINLYLTGLAPVIPP